MVSEQLREKQKKQAIYFTRPFRILPQFHCQMSYYEQTDEKRDAINPMILGDTILFERRDLTHNRNRGSGNEAFSERK